MALIDQLKDLLQDPAPEWMFELSEAGIAYAKPRETQPHFEPLEAGAIAVSPLADNVLKPETLAAAVRKITGAAGGRKRKRAVLILPDYCARVAVLGFDNFPTDPQEQLSLVRFRLKKSVPFDSESAAVSYHIQSKSSTRNVEVVVVIAAMEIIAHYEAPFRNSGVHPGVVTTSAIAACEMLPPTGISVVSRLNGKMLTVIVANGRTLKLVRCVELPDTTADEVMAVLIPTLAYVEDELQTTPERIQICGFSPDAATWLQELNVPVEPLRSRFGAPGQFNAGLLGYMESITGGGSKAA